MFHKSLFYFSAFALIFCAVSSSEAYAGEPRLLGKYGAWEAYVFTENGGKVCYMASRPQTDEGNYSRRGEIYALITHRPAEGSKNVFSYSAGYTYKSSSETTLKANGESFSLFTQDDTAWGPDAATDEALVKAIRAGSKMIVRGTSSRGTKTKDTFSLKGSSGAHNKMTQECGYK